MLPVRIRYIILRVYFFFDSIPEDAFHPIMKYLDSEPEVTKAYVVAKDAMDSINNLDVDTINKNKNLLSLYYAKKDGWVQIESYQKLKSIFSEIDAEVCTKGVAHGFAFYHHKEMAEYLKHKIQNFRN